MPARLCAAGAGGSSAESPEQYRRRASITKIAGPEGYLNKSADQDLDQLTLRLKAVEALLPLDKRKAVDLFRQIPRVTLPKVPCSDFLVYDVDRYYKILARVTSEGFDREQIEKGEPLHLLLEQAGSIALSRGDETSSKKSRLSRMYRWTS